MWLFFCYKTEFFNIVTTASYGFSPGTIESMCATLVKICTSRGVLLLALLKLSPANSLC